MSEGDEILCWIDWDHIRELQGGGLNLSLLLNIRQQLFSVCSSFGTDRE